MLQHRRNLTLDIFDYANHKLCTLYDSSSDISGQAHDIVKRTERNGWKELSFSIPSVCENEEGQQVENFRLGFLKADYRIRLIDDEGLDWFLISEPKIKHVNFSKDVSVTAGHIAQLLKTKNLGLEFSDKEGNNVGTAEQLLTTILDGTGWHVGTVEDFYEKRSDTDIKVRSMKAPAKTGAFKLIANMCDLFEAKPIYYMKEVEDEQGNKVWQRTVDIVHMNPFSEPKNGALPDVAQGKAIELHYGKNVSNVTRTLNTENLVTKLYCYGSYGDKTSGYCGIDEWHHLEYHMSVTAEAGKECRFQVEDQTADISYARYFKPTIDLNGSEDLIWSVLDPASMSYVWDDTNKLIYRIYDTLTDTDYAEVTIGSSETVTNQFSFLMDFDYYNSVGLLTDGMLQTIGEYQRNMPRLLIETNEAATAFSESLNELAETIGSVNFCKLDVSSYADNAGFVQMHLNKTEEHPEGVLYRTDYTVKKKDRFKWRIADILKENGDPLHTGASIVYIIHTHTTPVTFHTVYLKEKDTEDDPTDLTLWLDSDDFDSAHIDTDEVYLFQANTINGLLGAIQVMDESTVQSLETATKVVTTKHPVYFVKNLADAPAASVRNFSEYGWVWVYDELGVNASKMHFAHLISGDNTWKPVNFVDKIANVSDVVDNASSGDYCFAWRESMLYRYDGSKWNALNDSTQQKRIVATFGTVWQKCQMRDKLRNGYYQYYSYAISNEGLPVGKYAIQDEYGIYHAFTTEEAVPAGTSGQYVYYDTTNGWAIITDNYPVDNMADIIDKTIEVKDYRFDNVFENSANILEKTIWEAGAIEKGDGSYKPDSEIIKDGGGEIEGEGYRSGFCGVYPNVIYRVSGGIACTAYCYTMEHHFLGYFDINA